MRLLLDTQLTIWLVTASARLPGAARELIEDRANEVSFSVVSIWEAAIKHALGRPDFNADPRAVRRALIAADYRELPVVGDHAVELLSLPPIHRDPFDRMLVAQALSEGLALMTTDATLARYPGSIRRV